MRYNGGKSIIGKRISQELLKYKGNKEIYIEPFCGALGVLRHMSKHFNICYAYDACPDIIMLWQSIKDKKFPNPNMTKELFNELKNDKNPSALRGYAGFACSFGGIWQSTYTNEDNNKLYQNILKYHDKIQNVIFECLDYKQVLKKHNINMINNNLINFYYMDPPYINTMCTYPTIKFNHIEFYNIIKDINDIIIISEFCTPLNINYETIWTYKRIKNSNNSKTKSSIKEYYIEYLFKKV